MGYSYIYLFIILILFMFVLRFFLPFIIYLIPVFFIVYFIKQIFKKKEQSHTRQTHETYQDTYYQQNQSHSSNPDVIDADYKVVDEENNDAQ